MKFMKFVNLGASYIFSYLFMDETNSLYVWFWYINYT